MGSTAGLLGGRTRIFFSFLSLVAGVHRITNGQDREALGALSERRWVTALAEL